ncbi:peptidase S1 [Streptomyces flavofungini]|uniref:peptidase S1 n=1 Tax=Streptomyces flavofungini TaxID=68200 RepID=UPI0025AF3E40|nr:peptidase S1 [Streptomyces flavofungini]WJV44366.1 peptidase S1 [Streptomyces flavofungini]
MPNFIRKAAVLAAAMAASLLVSVAPAQADTPAPATQADTRYPIGGGTGIFQQFVQTPAGAKVKSCTLTAVGYDKAGDLVGLTNAHCFVDEAGNKVHGDKVYLDRSPHGTFFSPAPLPSSLEFLEVGVIGEVTYISEGNGYYTGGVAGPDYAVIKFDPTKVTPTNTVDSPSGSVTITSLGARPDVGTRLCKMGHRTGKTCGKVVGHGPESIGRFISAIATNAGDSGGPVVNGTTLVGNLWGFPGHTSIEFIIRDMNARGGVGAGFHLA